MAKNIPLSTIGVKIGYATEATAGAGTVPTSGWTRLHGIYSTPDFNVAPNTADTTSFDNEAYTSKTPLLREMPDNITFGVRFGQEFANEWESLESAYSTAEEAGKEIWFAITIPGYDKAIVFTGKPLPIGLPSMEANNNIDMDVYVTPTSEPKLQSGVTITD